MDEKKLTDEELIKRSECLNNYWKSFMLDIIARKDAVITEQKAEIERLKRYEMSESEFQKYCAYKIIEPQIRGCLDRERELQKQVDEYKAEIEALKNERVKTAQGLAVKTIFSMTAEHKKKLEEAEKNTAKEILDELLDIEVKDKDYETFFLDICEKLEKFAKKYGVEVE